MNPQLIQTLAESRRQELLREARRAHRAAALQNHPTFAARLIGSILSSREARRPAALPRVRPVEIDA
jgi:hypothetical protein